MAVYYLDTSAVLKRYRTEKGSDVVTELYEARAVGDSLMTSHFTCLEVESVAARALKGRVLTQHAYEALLGAFARDLTEHLYLLPLAGSLVNEAIYAARRHAVRAPDAIHVASAERTNRDSPNDFVFVASDLELLSAAEAAGVETFNPEAEGAIELLREWRKPSNGFTLPDARSR